MINSKYTAYHVHIYINILNCIYNNITYNPEMVIWQSGFKKQSLNVAVDCLINVANKQLRVNYLSTFI